MAVHAWLLDAVSGAPVNSGRTVRQSMSALMFGATAARPLGGRSGVRPGTVITTITATSTTWTVKPHSGMLDLETAAEASCYLYGSDANVTGSMRSAHATYARTDIICAHLDDPAETDGSSVPAVTFTYTYGPETGTVAPPATPARSLVLATILVPASGGGAPTVSWVAPYLQGGFVTVRNVTERAALYTSYPATTDCPVVVWQDDIGYLLNTVDGVNWKDGSGRFIWANATAQGAATGAVAGNAGLQLDTGATYTYTSGAWTIDDTGWITPTLTTGANVAGNSFGYRRRNGIVYLRGGVTGLATGNTMFTLPTGFHIDAGTDNTFLLNQAGASIMNFKSSGAIVVGYSAGTGTPFSFAAISFPVV